MLSYCLKYKKKTDSKNPRVMKTRKEKCFYQTVACNSKTPRLVKDQEANRIISSLGIKTKQLIVFIKSSFVLGVITS